MMMIPRSPRILAIAALTVSAAIALMGCGRYVPALFADRPVVTVVHDDAPIDLPSRRTFDERQHISDVYLRRPLFNVVRPSDFLTGGDVNAMDEVPTSSWFDAAQPVRVASDVLPPALPMTALDESPVIAEDALVVRDARGTRYELLTDPPDATGLHTAAEVVGGYLLRGLGLRAPRSWVLALPRPGVTAEDDKAQARLDGWLARKAALVDGDRRVSATLWPGGIDVGVAGDYSARRDDKNDRVDHHDRRTLRATKIFAHWLAWNRFGVGSTRDVYVGKPGEGHLVHYLVGTSRALGTQDLKAKDSLDEAGGDIWSNLYTFGLAGPTLSLARRSPFTSVGYLAPTLEPGDFEASVPYSAFVRLTPPDEYWAAKRLMDLPEDALRAGIEAAFMQPEAGRHLADVLTKRKRLLIAHAMTVVTPVDVATNVGRSVWLKDRAIVAGEAKASETVYDISFLDYDGTERATSVRIRAGGELTAIPLPKKILVGLVVFRVFSVRAGVESPRACDIHVMADRSNARVIGVRH